MPQERVCGKIDGERVRQKELMKNRKKYWEDGLVELESFSGTVLLLYQDKLAVMLEELFQVNKERMGSDVSKRSLELLLVS